MPAGQKVDVLIPSFSRAINLCLKEITKTAPKFNDIFESQDWKTEKEITVSLVIDSTGYKGTIYFHFGKPVAKFIVEKMLGEAVDENSLDMLDGIKEVTNIFFGLAKTKLNDAKINLNLSLPMAQWSKDMIHSTEPKKSIILPILLNDLDFYLEVII